MGWSEAKYIAKQTNDSKYIVSSNYANVNATWFQGTWFTNNSVAWIYTNTSTKKSKQLQTLTFYACAGHSNGKYYNGNGRSASNICYGRGSEFTADIYVADKSGTSVGKGKNVGTGKVPSINKYNCYYGGYGNVSTGDQNTSFGKRTLFGPGNGDAYHLDGNGVSRCREPVTLKFKNAPVIPPEGTMYVVVNGAIGMDATNRATTLLVIEYSSDYFDSEFKQPNESDDTDDDTPPQPSYTPKPDGDLDEDAPYIWVCRTVDGTKKWVREKVAYKLVKKGGEHVWEELKRD